MIRDERALTDRGEVAAPADLRSGNTLGGIVLTDGGAALGTLEDVVLEIEASAVVVGYQVRTSEALPPPPGGTVFLPASDDAVASGEGLVVPAAMADLAVNDVVALGAVLRSLSQRRKES